MAGGILKNPKNSKLQNKNLFSNETLKEGYEPVKKPVTHENKFSLRGILGLGQTVELNKSKSPESHVFFNNLVQEEKILLDSHKKEWVREIKELKNEIRKLFQSVKNLDKETEKLILEPVIEANEYQVNFLGRIRILLKNFSKNVNEVSNWMESYSKRQKSRKNAFWGKVKDRKHGGGEQYLNSGEHSASRSV